MRYLIFAVAVLFSAQAFAQDNIIRIIKEDGSVVEFEMGRPPEAAPEPAPVSASAPEPEPESTALPKSEPKAPAVVEKEPMAGVPETASQNAQAPVAEKPKKAAKPKAVVKTKASTSTVPIPMRKPAAAKYAAPDVYAPSRSDVTPGETVITKNVALAIALENDAPPARSVQVLPRNYEGRPVFVVQFRTEDGLYDMLIDRRSGEIVERKF